MPTIITRAGKGSALSGDDYDAGIKRTVVAKDANYALTAAHNREVHELANGITATLPTASAGLSQTGDWGITLKAMGTSAIIGRNSQLIDGDAEDITIIEGESITIAMNSAKDGFIVLGGRDNAGGADAIINTGAVGNGSQTVTLDLALGNFFFVDMISTGSDAVGTATMSLSNEPDNANTMFSFHIIFRRGGRKTVAMPTGYTAAGGTAPAMGNTDASYDTWLFYLEDIGGTKRRRYMLIDSV